MKLKPCPFCGAEKIKHEIDVQPVVTETHIVGYDIRATLFCPECQCFKRVRWDGALSAFEKKGQVEGILLEAWNTRKTLGEES